MDIELYQVDAFTREIFSGNPAGVVTNGDGLDDVTMQKIAREMNLSETAFIINKKTDDYDLEVRFFTPTREVPICGHATISAHYVYAKKNNINSSTIIQKTKAGILPVEIIPDGEDLKVAMTQAGIVFGETIEGERKQRIWKKIYPSRYGRISPRDGKSEFTIKQGEAKIVFQTSLRI